MVARFRGTPVLVIGGGSLGPARVESPDNEGLYKKMNRPAFPRGTLDEISDICGDQHLGLREVPCAHRVTMLCLSAIGEISDSRHRGGDRNRIMSVGARACRVRSYGAWLRPLRRQADRRNGRESTRGYQDDQPVEPDIARLWPVSSGCRRANAHRRVKLL
jgi:hypothetical protein